MDDYEYVDASTLAVVVLLKSAAALFSIWVGCGSLRWFWRGTIALAVVALLIPPRAYDPAIGLSIQIALVAGVIAVAKRWRRRAEVGGFLRCRFQLSDLFRIFFLVSLRLALILNLMRQPMLGNVLTIVHEARLQSILTLATAILVLLPTSRLRRVLATSPLVVLWFLWGFMEFSRQSRENPWEFDATNLQTFWLRYGVLALAVCLVSFASLTALKQLHRVAGGSFRRADAVLSRFWLVGGGIISAALMLFLWWKMTFLPRPPRIIIPVPNGYDALVRAAKLIQGDNGYDFIANEGLPEHLRANQHAIDLTREAVKLDCQSPIEFVSGPKEFGCFHSSGWILPRILWRSVHLALLEGHPDDAVDNSIVNLQLCARIRDSGLADVYLEGKLHESATILELTPARAKFIVPQSRRLLTAMLAIDRQRLPEPKIEELDRIWHLHHQDYQYVFLDAIGSVRGRQAGWLEEYSLAIDTQRELFLLDLAIRVFRREQRQFPQSLDELVPDVLPKLPQDPYTKRPFVYRRDAVMGFLLYSAGSDGDDDGGIPVSWYAGDFYAGQLENGDFFLDRSDNQEERLRHSVD